MMFEGIELLSDEDLILLRSRVRKEMRKRQIADSVGIIGEQLAVSYFSRTHGLPKLQLAPRGTKNVDAFSRNGDRYSIKTICEGSKTGTIYPEQDNPDKQLFEFILIVKLSEDWALKSIHQLSWANFVIVRSWDKRMNAWYIGISSRTLGAATFIFDASGSQDV